MHEPVLATEVVDFLVRSAGGVYVDCTAGNGGHSLAILERLDERGILVCIDRDADAIESCRARLSGRRGRVVLVHSNYTDIGEVILREGLGGVDGVLLDLGVSSMQLETAERGFSLMRDGPLDMRMDRSERGTAADLVNGLSEAALADLIYGFGEERRSRRIARAVVAERESNGPIHTTSRLAKVVERSAGGRRGRIHPATRTFLALRIAVNGELAALKAGLEACVRTLKPGGRIAVISFHSLEDRIAKRFFIGHSVGYGGTTGAGEGCGVRLQAASRKPIRPSEEEIAGNARARSAKLRMAERLA